VTARPDKDYAAWLAGARLVLGRAPAACFFAAVLAPPAACRKAPPPLLPATTAPAATLVGDPADWSTTARIVRETATTVRCLDRSTRAGHARAIGGDPARAEDVNVSDGSVAPADIDLTVLATGGCPWLAPDGKRIVYNAMFEGRRSVMHAFSPDGRNASPLFGGDAFGWASNDAAIVSADGARAALLAAPGALRLLPAAVDPSARLVAVATGSAELAPIYRSGDGTLVDRHDRGSLRRIRSLRLSLVAAAAAFDGQDTRLGLAVTERGDGVWVHWQDGASPRRVGRLPGESIAHAVVIGDRLVLATTWKGGARLRVAPAKSAP
jgi:hypothetical protein